MKYQMILRNLGKSLVSVLKKKGTINVIAIAGLILIAASFPGKSIAGRMQTDEIDTGLPFETLASIVNTEESEEKVEVEEDKHLEKMEEIKLDSLQAYKRIVSKVRIELAESYIGEPIEIAADSLEGIFGIKANMYESFYGEKSTLENSSDTYLIIKSTEENKEEIKNLLNDYINRLKATASTRDELKYRQARVGEHEEYLILSVLGAKSVNNYKSVPEAEKEYSNFNKLAVDIGLSGVSSLEEREVLP